MNDIPSHVTLIVLKSGCMALMMRKSFYELGLHDVHCKIRLSTPPMSLTRYIIVRDLVSGVKAVLELPIKKNKRKTLNSYLFLY